MTTDTTRTQTGTPVRTTARTPLWTAAPGPNGATGTSGPGGENAADDAGAVGDVAVQVVPEQLSALAVSLRDAAPTVHRSTERPPAGDTGDRDAGDALEAFYRAHDRALSAAVADHRASADHLDVAARAYTVTEQHNARQCTPDSNGPGPGGNERRFRS